LGCGVVCILIGINIGLTLVMQTDPALYLAMLHKDSDNLYYYYYYYSKVRLDWTGLDWTMSIVICACGTKLVVKIVLWRHPVESVVPK
jgi:hypothetical protein